MKLDCCHPNPFGLSHPNPFGLSHPNPFGLSHLNPFGLSLSKPPVSITRWPPTWRHVHLGGHYTFRGDGQAIDLDAIIQALNLD